MKKGTCSTTGKKRYRDEIAAKLVLATIDKGQKRAYWCSFCRGWHLTSQQQRTRKVSEQLTSGGSS